MSCAASSSGSKQGGLCSSQHVDDTRIPTQVVTNVTCAINSQVPRVIAAVVDKLSSMGAPEVYETAEKTRSYLAGLAADEC